MKTAQLPEAVTVSYVGKGWKFPAGQNTAKDAREETALEIAAWALQVETSETAEPAPAAPATPVPGAGQSGPPVNSPASSDPKGA